MEWYLPSLFSSHSVPHISSPALYSHLRKHKQTHKLIDLVKMMHQCITYTSHFTQLILMCSTFWTLNVTFVKIKWKSVDVWNKINPWDWKYDLGSDLISQIMFAGVFGRVVRWAIVTNVHSSICVSLTALRCIE